MGELEHYTKNSDPFFLLTPSGSLLPMRQSPGKNTQVLRSPAAHSAPQGCSSSCGGWLLSHTSLPAPSATTSHPKSHHVQRPGGLMNHRRHFWTVQPDQQLVVASTSSPHHRRKGLLCSWLYCILLIIISMAEVGQKQGTLRNTSNSGINTAERIWAKGCCSECQDAWAALPAIFLWLMLTLDDTSWNSSNCWKIFYCSFLWTSAEHMNKSQQQPQLTWGHILMLRCLSSEIYCDSIDTYLKNNLLEMLADIHIQAQYN